MNSRREIPDCVQMDRNVEPLMRGWLGIVNGVTVPSSFSRAMEICSFSRAMSNPKIFSALITRFFGASLASISTDTIFYLNQERCSSVFRDFSSAVRSISVLKNCVF